MGHADLRWNSRDLLFTFSKRFNWRLVRLTILYYVTPTSFPYFAERGELSYAFPSGHADEDEVEAGQNRSARTAMFVIHENTGAIMTIIVMMIRILMATLYARASKRTREREREREREATLCCVGCLLFKKHIQTGREREREQSYHRNTCFDGWLTIGIHTPVPLMYVCIYIVYMPPSEMRPFAYIR